MRISSAFTFLASASVFLSNPLAAQTVPGSQQDRATAMSDQARFVVNYMQAAGNETLVVMDKNNGELLVIDNGNVVMRSPALYGKGKGEDVNKDPSTTPAGIFAMREYSVSTKDYQGGRALGFLNVKNDSYIIHPTYQHFRSQQRDERLASPTPDDNAISFGCINVPYAFYDSMVPYLKEKAIIRQSGAGYVTSLPRLVILPKTRDLSLTAQILGINAPSSRPEPARP